MNIFVTGASGFIGRQFLSELLVKVAPGCCIWVLVRSPLNYADTRIKELQGDLKAIASFRKELLESDYVFHLAANATLGSDNNYNEVNYLPTAELVELLRSSNRLCNLVFTSTIGAVDRAPQDDCRSPLTIQSVANPRSHYGESKLKAERYIRESGLPATIIRPTWVYGSDMRTASHINRFVSMVYDNHPVTHFAFPGKVSLIHVRDLAQSLVLCINNQSVIGRTYFAETEALSIGDIFAVIAEKLRGKRPVQIPIPSISSIIARLHAMLPLNISNLFVGYLWANDTAFRADFDVSSPVLFADGVKDVIRSNIRTAGRWVITGANSGIGFALANKLAASGKKIVLIDKDTDNLSQFSNATIIRADLSIKSEIDGICRALSGVKIACLVNNAGIGVRGPIRETSTDAITRIVAVNALAPVLLTRKLIENLVTNEAVIVNVASSIAYNPLPFMSLYSSTKAFISNWSESLTYELRKTNTVITFSPSGTMTGFQQSAGVKVMNRGKGLLAPEYVAERIHNAIHRRKRVVILGLPTKVLLFVSKLLPRSLNISLWGTLFEKYR